LVLGLFNATREAKSRISDEKRNYSGREEEIVAGKFSGWFLVPLEL